MLNVIAIYLICLYFITLGITRTKDGLVVGILFIVGMCLGFGFFYYVALFLALPSINVPGFIVLSLFPVYLALK